MKPIFEPPHVCSIDPITLTGLAVGALGGLGAGAATGAFGGSGSATAMAPPQQPAAPPPQQQPQGTKPLPQTQSSTFLGAAATPQPTQSGQKTLLGQ